MRNKKFMVWLGVVAAFLLVFIISSLIYLDTDLYVSESEELSASETQHWTHSLLARESLHINEVFAHLTQEDFIYDVEYLVYALRNNFAQTVILEQRGFDINQMAENVIERILANETINIEMFWHILWMEFFQDIWGLGILQN